MINIVIVGAGFGGLRAALGLEKKYKNNKNVSITLIDKRNYHLFTPNLYEVASAEEELSTLSQMKKSITLPLRKIIGSKRIQFIQGEVKEVEIAEKKVVLTGKQIPYDYLILAIGSQSDFFGIEGAEQNSLVLKSLADAFRIRNKIEFAVQAQQYESGKKTLRIVVAGGGYTGLELVCELKGLLDILALKYVYPREKLELEVVEAGTKVVAGFDSRLSEDAYQRLQELNIRVRLSSRISKVDRNFIELMSGEKIAYDVLLWTAGVKAGSMACSIQLTLDKKSKMCVNSFFQVEGHNNIFALGDVAGVIDKRGRPVPCSAQDAVDQAEYLVKALPLITKNKTPQISYIPKKHGFIVNLGGKWAIVDYGPLYIRGFLGFVINQFAHLRYYISIVGVLKGIKWLLFQEQLYSRND